MKTKLSLGFRIYFRFSSTFRDQSFWETVS